MKSGAALNSRLDMAIEQWLLCMCVRKEGTSNIAFELTDCVTFVNHLSLNAAYTEIMWCAPPRQQDKLPVTSLSVGSDSVTPVRCVRDLRIFIDSDISMRTHVLKTVAKCFASLRRL